MEETIPFRIVPCIDLSDHSLTTSSNHPSGLCTVCQNIDFVSLTSKTCECHKDKRHFHIGTLQPVARKKFCPGCRLILSAARSIDPSHNTLDESTIIIKRLFLSAYSREPNYSLHGNGATEDNAKTRAVEKLSMESLIEVIFDGDSEQLVAGTIIRAEEAEIADSMGLKPTVLQSEVAFCVRGRNVPPKVNINLIKHWMQSCNLLHERCRLPALAIAREQNIRLIDVQDYRIVLATSAEKYVALSYVWGPTTTPLLIRDTMSQCSSLNGLKDLMIPRTISDAIQLVKDIDQRYLWVDSLCIVQDDDDDKQQQLPIMDSIYSNAELVVVAAAGSDANAGIPGIQGTQRRISQRIEKVNGTQFITSQPSIQQILKRSVWNSRGWTFQEAILSRRALVFTESLVYWNCQVDTWREDINSESSVACLLIDEANSLRGPIERDMCRTRRYCELVEAFSQRAFKDERDIIWALIGILKLQASHFRKGFIWGHPLERLDATLLWSGLSSCINVHSRHVRHAVVRKGSLYDLPYPSWSWSSTNIKVSFMDSCGASIVSEVTWHEPFKLGDRTLATYLESTHLKGPTDELENQLSVSLPAGSTSELHIMDYGLLHFTAQTAVLTLRRAKKSSRNPGATRERTLGGDEDKADRDHTDEDDWSSNHWVKATIHSLVGERIGMLTVPLHFFNEKSERSGEFVLLSSNAQEKADEICKKVSGGLDCGSFKHADGCRHILSRNIMLIEWDGDVAFRRGLGRVEKESWEKVETQAKKIILG